MVRIHAIGDWPPGAVVTDWAASSLCIPNEAQALIDRAWAEASLRLGTKLFDGPMCRLENVLATPQRLRLRLSRTSYRIFLGTNLTHARLADQYGPNCLANPVGMSTALLTADGLLVMGHRNASVAYYPERVHPFAGALEPGDDDAPADVFAEVRRELREELSLGDADLVDLRCIGLVEDVSIRQPELVFLVQSSKSRSAIEAQLDAREHRSMWSMPASEGGITAALSEAQAFTPVAIGTLLLWGHRALGDAWLARVGPRWLSGSLPSARDRA